LSVSANFAVAIGSNNKTAMSKIIPMRIATKPSNPIKGLDNAPAIIITVPTIITIIGIKKYTTSRTKSLRPSIIFFSN